jgi:hypothetical protein
MKLILDIFRYSNEIAEVQPRSGSHPNIYICCVYRLTIPQSRLPQHTPLTAYVTPAPAQQIVDALS